MIGQSFIFGKGTENPTYESLRKRRQIIDLMQAQAVGQTPQNMWEGIEAVGKALIGRYADSKLAPQEDEERKRIADILGGLGSGSTVMGAPIGPVAGAPGGFTGAGYSGMPEAAAPVSGQPVAPAMGGPAGYRDAIAGIESAGSGDYAALGPVTGSGDRAYGRYQVMGANIPEWTQAALGRPMTPEEFIANPQAQDATFDHRFGGYVNKYGPEGAARAWFSGEGGMDNPAASDGYITNDQYAAKFMGGLGGNAGMDMMGMAGFGQPDMARLSQLADVMGNPYASDGQKIVAQALIERELGKGDGDALGWARLALDREKFAQGTREGPKFYGNVQWADRTPDDGIDNPVPYQIGSDGQVSWIDLQGATPLPPVKNVNAGTEFVVQGPGGTQVAPPIAIDNQGKATQTKVGETVATAAAGLPVKAEAFQRIDAAGRDLINDKALPSVLGNVQGRFPTFTQAQANVQAKIDTFVNQTFPMAMESLRGLGPASEMEGMAAQRAIANLDQKQDPEQFIAVIEEAIAHIRKGFEIAEQQAQGNVLPQPGVPSSEWPEWMNGDPTKWTQEQLEEAERLIGGRR